MKPPTGHANRVRLAIGYVRVSTHEQVQDGVSLDVQRDKLRAYCKLHDIKLVDIKADEGISGATMERPGLQAALRLLEIGKADTLIVAKLDRLTRSVKDLCLLVDKYFAPERYHLLSICGMVNTPTAAERLTAERHIPQRASAWHAATVRSLLRRPIDETSKSAAEVARDLQDAGKSLRQIGRALSEKGYEPQRGGRWHPAMVMHLLSPA